MNHEQQQEIRKLARLIRTDDHFARLGKVMGEVYRRKEAAKKTALLRQKLGKQAAPKQPEKQAAVKPATRTKADIPEWFDRVNEALQKEAELNKEAWIGAAASVASRALPFLATKLPWLARFLPGAARAGTSLIPAGARMLPQAGKVVGLAPWLKGGLNAAGWLGTGMMLPGLFGGGQTASQPGIGQLAAESPYGMPYGNPYGGMPPQQQQAPGITFNLPLLDPHGQPMKYNQSKADQPPDWARGMYVR
jgi:hypothetical protein